MRLGNFQGRPFRALAAAGLKDHAFWVAGNAVVQSIVTSHPQPLLLSPATPAQGLMRLGFEGVRRLLRNKPKIARTASDVAAVAAGGNTVGGNAAGGQFKGKAERATPRTLDVHAFAVGIAPATPRFT